MLMREKEAGLPESTLSVVMAFNSKQKTKTQNKPKKNPTLSNPKL